MKRLPKSYRMGVAGLFSLVAATILPNLANAQNVTDATLSPHTTIASAVETATRSLDLTIPYTTDSSMAFQASLSDDRSSQQKSLWPQNHRQQEPPNSNFSPIPKSGNSDTTDSGSVVDVNIICCSDHLHNVYHYPYNQFNPGFGVFVPVPGASAIGVGVVAYDNSFNELTLGLGTSFSPYSLHVPPGFNITPGITVGLGSGYQGRVKTAPFLAQASVAFSWDNSPKYLPDSFQVGLLPGGLVAKNGTNVLTFSVGYSFKVEKNVLTTAERGVKKLFGYGAYSTTNQKQTAPESVTWTPGQKAAAEAAALAM